MVAWLEMAIGLGVLCLGAEVLVSGAVSLASRLRVSLLVIGLTVVAFGTSAPELAVTVGAGLRGLPGIAVGNIVGSNTFNAALILGVAALIRPLAVHRRIVRLDLPVAVASAVLLAFLVMDGALQRFEGLVFLGAFAVYMCWLLREGRRDATRTEAESGNVQHRYHGLPVACVSVVGGLAALWGGSRLFLNGAILAGEVLGLPQAVVGLTISAAGTSLPELATSVAAARRGEADLAVGNVVGSNTFNILAALGTSAFLRPSGLGGVNWVDMWFMLGVTLALFPLMFTGMRLTRPEGFVLVLAYLGYLVYVWQRVSPIGA